MPIERHVERDRAVVSSGSSMEERLHASDSELFGAVMETRQQVSELALKVERLSGLVEQWLAQQKDVPERVTRLEAWREEMDRRTMFARWVVAIGLPALIGLLALAAAHLKWQ